MDEEERNVNHDLNYSKDFLCICVLMQVVLNRLVELPSIVIVSHAVERPLYAHHPPYEHLVKHHLPRKYIAS